MSAAATADKINISVKNTAGKCQSKCSLQFTYTESSLTAHNDGNSVRVSYESSATSPVTYNSQKYNVGEIVLYSPAIHLFNGEQLPGEFVVTHYPVLGGNTLKIALPLATGTPAPEGAQHVQQIIDEVAMYAPRSGESVSLSDITGFSLQQVIPSGRGRGFFMYTESQTQTDWIVFGSVDSLSIPSSSLESLANIISPFEGIATTATGNPSVFYNSSGVQSGVSVGDGLYISCQPTGSSTEDVAVSYDKPGSTYDWSSVTNNSTVRTGLFILASMLIFLCIYYGMSQVFRRLSVGGGGNASSNTIVSSMGAV